MTLAACIWYESSTKFGNKNKIRPSHKITHHPLLSRVFYRRSTAGAASQQHSDLVVISKID